MSNGKNYSGDIVSVTLNRTVDGKGWYWTMPDGHKGSPFYKEDAVGMSQHDQIFKFGFVIDPAQEVD